MFCLILINYSLITIVSYFKVQRYLTACFPSYPRDIHPHSSLLSSSFLHPSFPSPLPLSFLFLLPSFHSSNYLLSRYVISISSLTRFIPINSLSLRSSLVSRTNPGFVLLLCYLFSCVRLFVTPWTVACQAPLSMEFSSQEYCHR